MLLMFRKWGISGKKKHVIRFGTEKKKNWNFSILGHFKNFEQMSSREKYLLHILFGAFQVPPPYLLKNNFLKRVMTQRGFRKFFPDKFHLYLLRKKCFQKIVWKNFPEILLSHHPKNVNFNFYFKSCILEKFSMNSPESWPKILQMAFGNIFQKTSWFTTRIFRCDQFRTQIFEKGYLRG